MGGPPGLQLAALLGKYGKLRSSEITPAIVVEVATGMGLPQPAKDAIAKTLDAIHEGGDEAVGQWFAIPGNRDKVRKFLASEQNDDVLLRCPHCDNLIAFDPHTQLSSGSG
jgi:hypothetical protein